MKLKEVVFRCGFLDIEWVAMALETIAKHQNLQRITIDTSSTTTPTGQEMLWTDKERACRLWSGLDPLLVQLWESHSIHTRILFPQLGPDDEGRRVADWPEGILPESSKQGIINLAKSGYSR